MKKYILSLIFMFSLIFSQGWIQSQVIERKFNQAVENYNEGKYATTSTILKRLLADNPLSFEEPSLLLLLKSQVALDQTEQAKETARVFFAKFPKTIYLVNIMETLGDLYVNESAFESAYRMYHRSRSLSSNFKTTNKIDSKLLKLIKVRLPSSILNEMLILESKKESINIHLLAKANSDMLNGLPDESAIILNKIDPLFLPDIYALFYENLLRRSYEPPSAVLMVGIVLPISGKNAKEGEAFLSGFYAGEKSFNKDNQRLSILVKDTRSNDLQAIIDARNLEKMNQIKTIISPLNEQSSLAITSALSNTDLPIILTNTQQNDLSNINSKTFHFNSTLATQGKMAARYAVNQLGLKFLAVVSPADQNGEIQTDAFIKEVDLLGANVVVSEWYSGQPKNLKRQFKNIRRIAFDLLPKEENYDEALGMSIDSLDALFDISTEDYFDLPKKKKNKMSSSDSSKVILSTIDGIYLPINLDDLEFIGPQIPMYNLETKIIGNNNWQNLNILQKENIGPHIKGLSIITNFTQQNTDPELYNGNQQYSFYNGYNVAKLLTQVDIEDQSRELLNNALRNLDFHKGVGFFYSPSQSNKQINSAFQIIEFDGKGFKHQGVFRGDSLELILTQNP
ncbi:MAG: ABC transporter substrate-binding protein [Candidatus Marinimicrobia bacterium]|jgi:ABC-type branched-subunit amino acid transport system substrate-binding protein|nr:ABC transporter substrate-binding protein [Candidatus Neomarinimicrobiota bacterium]